MNLTPEVQFWMDWWLKVAGAVATMSAVVVALFKDAIISRLFPLKLEIELLNSVGEWSPIRMQWQNEQGQIEQKDSEARYYHLRVSNKRPWRVATNVQVYLLSVEEPGPDKRFQLKWVNAIPMTWRHREIYPLTRTVGSPIDCDLCSVVKEGYLQLHLLIAPNALPTHLEGEQFMVLTVEARANEGVSKIRRIQIAWDGQWDKADSEMQKHVRIEDVTGQTNG